MRKTIVVALVLSLLTGCMLPVATPSEFYFGSRRVDKYEAKQVQKEKSWKCIIWGTCNPEESHGS